MPEDSNSAESRKVLFLFFSPDAEERLIKRIASHEYEVYAISEKLDPYLRFIRENPNAIIFVNSSNYPKNSNWRDNFLLLDASCREHDIKISTWDKDGTIFRNNPDLTNFPASIPEIDIREGYDGISEMILAFLKENNARGRRTFVRIRCDDCYSATFSVKHHNTIHIGTILDISTVAIACTFSDGLELKVDTHFEDIQIRLSGHIASIAGTVFRKRDIGGKTVYIILLDVKKFPETRAKICEYIYNCLQKQIKLEKEK